MRGKDQALIIALPEGCAQGSLELDCAAIAATPPVEGGFKTLEGRLELALLPSQNLGPCAQSLASFEETIDQRVRAHVEQLLEEVDAAQAQVLMAHDETVKERERAIVGLRVLIERERRGQEAAARELRARADDARGGEREGREGLGPRAGQGQGGRRK